MSEHRRGEAPSSCALALLAALVWLASIGRAAVADPIPPPLRIAVYDTAPYGYVATDGSIAGVSVDLWRRIDEQLKRPYELTAVADMNDVLGGLEQGRFDAAIGAITITPEREERVDFSYPAHRSGVAVARRRETGPLSALTAYGAAASDLSPLIVIILVSLVLTGIAMWIIERGSQAAERGESHVASLRDGLYWAVVTMTTVGYGDKTPKTTSGRLVATLWMFGSLVLVSLLSTSLVSRLTADRVERNEVTSTIDLDGRALGAVTASSGAEYLDRHHLHYTAYKTLAAALDSLADRKTDEVVNSVGALKDLVARRYKAKLEVADGLLERAYMAIALPRQSALKHPIDRALIKVTSEPEWLALEDRYFGK